MKNVFVIALGIILSAGAGAVPGTQSYSLNLELSLDGKPASSARMVVRENEPASFQHTDEKSQDGSSIEVVASEFSSEEQGDGIRMNFVITKIVGGKRVVVAKPKVMGRPGSEVSVANPTEKFELKVTATRI